MGTTSEALEQAVIGKQHALIVTQYPRDTKIAELEKKLASKTKVDSVLQLRNRNKNIPSAGSRESMDSGSADGPVVPAAAIKSRADFKKFLEN